jgi:hypothetical protein
MTKTIACTLMLTSLLVPAASMAQTPGKLVLQIHHVLCVKETSSGTFIGTFGDDHMILGGVAITPGGKKTQIKAVGVGTFEEAGRHETFAPPKAFATIPVASTLRDYNVMLVLAEQDIKGGTDDFVRGLLTGSAAAGADSAKADGGASVVAAEAGKEIVKELGKLAVERLKTNAKDDIFPTQTVNVTLRKSDRLFANGKTMSPREKLTFNGHGGRYTITYSWKLVP